jgi:hypothetical protein
MTHLICAVLALSAGPPKPHSDVQDLFYLSPKGPVLIRLASASMAGRSGRSSAP